jgi:hypothetical protein
MKMKIKMKSIFNFLLAAMIVSVLVSSCTDDFEEINTNTRVLSKLDKATIGNVFARTQYRGMLYRNYQIFNNLFADNYAQYCSIIQTKFPSDRYIVVGGWVNADWSSFYANGANNLAIVLDLTTPAENEGMEAHHAIAQIEKVLYYQQMTDYWGPIPYSEVGLGGKSVAYDSQEAIYDDFFALLDSALTTLKSHQGGNAFGSHDQIFGGDIDSWIKFGNSVRLRCAMRISDVKPAKAKIEAEKAVAGGVMTATSDDAIFHVTPDSYNLLNRMVPWNEFRMSATMESVLKGYNDPRLPKFFGPTENSIEAGGELEWHGLRNGYSISDLGVIPEIQSKATSRYAERWQDPNARGSNNIEVMHSSESYFLRAEGALKGWNMGGNAKDLYEEGIRQSLQWWVPGIADADIDAYINSEATPAATFDVPADMAFSTPIKWSAEKNIQLEQIARQKWLALFPNGVEAWADVRRAERPLRYDIMVSDNPHLSTKDLIRRTPFVSGEYETNAEGVESGKALLGGPDNAATRLWWDK